MTFTEQERDYLATQRIARLATVAPDGTVQNSPVGFFRNDELGTIDIWGRAMGRSKKFRNLADHPKVALVIDDLASLQPWHVRGVEIRGTAEALTDLDPPTAHFSREVIRIRPEKIISWGLDGDPYTGTSRVA